jgi:hypothetical protein
MLQMARGGWQRAARKTAPLAILSPSRARGRGGGEGGRACLSARGRGSAGRTVVLLVDVALARFLGVKTSFVLGV